MKTLLQSKLLLTITIILFVYNCKVEDDDLFPNMEKSIQNDGYLPLAVDNKWEYENWLVFRDRGIEKSIRDNLGSPANSDDDAFEYTGSKLESYHPIGGVVYTEKKDGTHSFDYSFSPLEGLGKTIGGFFGNFYQITKIGGEYRRKSIEKKDSINAKGETVKTDYFYELDDQVFLTDNPTPGTALSSKTGSFGDSLKNGIYLEYEVKTYVTRVLPNGLPSNLTNKAGIDDHLKKYKNVLHTTDTIKIKKLLSKSKGGVRMRVKANVRIPKGTSRIETRTVGNTKLYGDLLLAGTGLLLIPVVVLAETTGNDINSAILISDTKLNLSLCEVVGEIDLDEVIEGAKVTYVSEEPLYFVDSYWVKGVGNIKNITSPAKFDAVINTSSEADPLSTGLNLAPVDEKCVNNFNTLELALKYKGGPSVGKIQVPLTLETRSYVQNLRNMVKRNQLN